VHQLVNKDFDTVWSSWIGFPTLDDETTTWSRNDKKKRPVDKAQGSEEQRTHIFILLW